MWVKTDFVSVSGVGTHTVTGLCFAPKALLIWTNGAGDSGFDPAIWRMSMCTSAADQITHRIQIDTGSSTFLNQDLPGEMGDGFTFVSFDSDGFTLNLPDNDLHQFFYAAFGGDNLEAYVGGFDTNVSGLADVVVSGLGFQPDFLLTMNGETSGGFDATAGIGMASSPAAQGCETTYRYLFNAIASFFWDTHLVEVWKGNTGNEARLTLASFDVDGFTLTTDIAAGGSVPIHFLALRDPTATFKVGTDSQKTSTGTKSTSGVGFQPGAGLFVGGKRTAVFADDVSPTGLSLNAADGARSNTETIWSTTGPDATYANHPALLAAIDPASTLLAEAQLDSFDPDGFTLDWTTADAVARKFVYAMFETETPDNNPCDVWIPHIYRWFIGNRVAVP